MTYLISQIWLYLLCAGLLGLLLGWIIWGWWSRRLVAEANANHERERLALVQRFDTDKIALQEDKAAAVQARDEALKIKASFVGKLESERMAAAGAKAQIDRLTQADVAARGEYERNLAALQEQIELERSAAAEAKNAVDAIRADMRDEQQEKEAALTASESANGTLRARLDKLEAGARQTETGLKASLEEEQRAKAALEAELMNERADLSKAKDTIDETRAEVNRQIQAKQAALAAAQSEAKLKAEMADAEMVRLRSVVERADTTSGGIDEVRRSMRQMIDEERRAKVTAESEHSRLLAGEREAKAEIERLRSKLSAMPTRGQDDSAEAERLRSELGEARQRQGGLETEVARLRTLLRERETVSKKPTDKQTFTTDAPRPASLYDRRPDVVDDLKAVKGIGPVMEGILNENGCYHFKQLANFSPRDIEWISQALGSFPDRIERDGWVDQAKTLYFKKYGQSHDVGKIRTLETTS